MRKYLIIILVLLAANFALFHKLYFQGLLPFPGDLLVSYYFPWNGGGFLGFDPWTTRKDVIAMDVIRQIYPWKTLAFDLIKQGQLPLWNPFNFSGTPLLANLQSSIFFPGGLLFLLLPYLPAWIIQVIALPFLFSVFSYIFLRSLNLSKIAALFGAIAISNISYVVVWAEQLVVIQSALFLPLILWLINRKKFLWAAPLLAFSIFGGHIQTSVYVYLIVFAYALFKKTDLRAFLLTLVLFLALSAVQMIPTLELYFLSAREGAASQMLFYQSTFPWANLITVLVPDFFGNPATNNFRGMDYGNFQGYYGVAALLLSVFAALNFKKNKTIIFFTLLGFGGLLFSLAPFAHLFSILKIPILSSGYPSRMVFIFQFSFAILAAFGLNFLLKSERSKIFLVIILIGLIYLICLIVSFVLPEAHWQITRNNLILPIGMLLATAILIVAANFLPRKILLFLVILAIFEYSYFFNKYQPFAPLKFVFPNHPVFSEIKKNNGLNRFMGVDRAYIDNNFATYFRVYSPEGYDPLYIKRYGEFLSVNGKIQRSDATISSENLEQRDIILDILGVKLIIDKTDDPKNDWGPNEDRFPKEKYKFLKQINKWKFYERKTAHPRAKVIGGSAKIISYSPNRVEINTTAKANGMLVLSDNFYPGWQAFVDGKQEEIFPAYETFRSILVPAGSHKVVFNYDPISFKIGLALTIFGLIFWLICLKKFR